MEIEDEIKLLPPFPAVAILKSDADGMQLFLVVEKQLLVTFSPDFKTAILTLVAAYFSFDMAYPKPPYSTLLFIQHYMLTGVHNNTITVREEGV